MFLVLQIPAFHVPGFKNSGFSCSWFYRFRLFMFLVLQIPAFHVPGFTDSGFSCSWFSRSSFLVPFPDSPFLVLQIAVLGLAKPNMHPACGTIRLSSCQIYARLVPRCMISACKWLVHVNNKWFSSSQWKLWLCQARNNNQSHAKLN